MARIDEVVKEIDLKTLTDTVNALDKNDPNYTATYKGIVNTFLSKVINILDKESLEIRVGILDMLFNISPAFTRNIVASNNENIIRAQLVLESIKGISPSDIKDNIDVAKTAYSLYAFSSGLMSNKSSSITTHGYGICEILSKYLSKMDNDDINEMVGNDVLEFYKNIGEVDNLLFAKLQSVYVPSRGKFIKNLFTLPNIDDETLSDIFNNVFEKNAFLDSFDYSDIIESDPTLLQRVKGLYRKTKGDLFDFIINEDMYESEEEYEEAIDFFGDIASLNEGDEDGLKKFFMEISKRADRCPKLIEKLENEEFYNRYVIKDLNAEYENAVNKILSGNEKVSDYLIEEIGKSKVFIDNFDKILDCFAKSNDAEYQRSLIFPLTVALAEKQKEKYGLDFDVVSQSETLGIGTLGYYKHSDNVIYFNPFYMKYTEDVKNELANAFDTVIHEVRHARQYKEVEQDDHLSYDNLLMAMDFYLTDDSLSGYYKTNYAHLSYERDARACAYAETKELLKKYPDICEKVKPEDISKFELSDYIRKKEILSIEDYYGILDIFEEGVKIDLTCVKDDPDLHEYAKNKLLNYPVILQFYDYDEENNTLTRKNDEYFDKKLKELENEPDSLAKRETIYSIKAFRYAQKVSDYIHEHENLTSFDNPTNGYSDEVIEEVTNAVGKRPSR
jgi:hypothetical protein